MVVRVGQDGPGSTPEGVRFRCMNRSCLAFVSRCYGIRPAAVRANEHGRAFTQASGNWTGRSEPSEGNRACSNPDGREEGGALSRARLRAPVPIDPGCPKQGRAFRSRLKRSAIQARAPLATGSPMRSQRRAAFVFMRAGGRRFRRQRSEQYRTSSQAAFHFFLQLKGKPQVSQIFSGKCILSTMANHASRRISDELPGRATLPRRYTGPVAIAHRRLSAHRRPATDGATTLPACAGRARSRRRRARTPGRSRRP